MSLCIAALLTLWSLSIDVYWCLLAHGSHSNSSDFSVPVLSPYHKCLWSSVWLVCQRPALPVCCRASSTTVPCCTRCLWWERTTSLWRGPRWRTSPLDPMVSVDTPSPLSPSSSPSLDISHSHAYTVFNHLLQYNFFLMSMACFVTPERKTIFFNSHEVSKPESCSHLTAVSTTSTPTINSVQFDSLALIPVQLNSISFTLFYLTHCVQLALYYPGPVFIMCLKVVVLS